MGTEYIITAHKGVAGRQCFIPVYHSLHRGSAFPQCHRAGRPPIGRPTSLQIIWDMVNKRVVHILLECILVELFSPHKS